MLVPSDDLTYRMLGSTVGYYAPTAARPSHSLALRRISPIAMAGLCHRGFSDNRRVPATGDALEESRARLVRRGFRLEYATLGWNVVGIVVLGLAAFAARSVALAGFGLDSLIEIGASTVVLWELSGQHEERQGKALLLIAMAFLALGAYLAVQSTLVLASGFRPQHSPVGMAWTALTAAVMFTLAAGKARAGRALGNPVLSTEGRVTLIDGILAVAVFMGLTLNTAAGWWWADPLAGYVLLYYAFREARAILREKHEHRAVERP
jgi:divalent metal cation (Fe/Co/Zn/Cd) transporter